MRQHKAEILRFTSEPLVMATGLECSYPKVQHGRRRDELEETRHYQRWREDFELCRRVGARFVRYGPPYYRMHAGPGKYDWSWTDEVLPVMRDMGLTPIVDLCHFGLPDWLGDFQNTDWPALFAGYAGAFAERYPWIQYYTPVNEILVCARFSAKLGWWNEQATSDRALVTALRNLCRATILASLSILHVVPDAVFIQSETAEAVHERWPETRPKVEFANQLRFVTFDLLYGHPPDGRVLLYLLDNGLKREDFEWFQHHGQVNDPHCILGLDYYARNERYACPDGSEEADGPSVGWHAIGLSYFHRYHKPMMLTETNHLDPEQAPSWIWRMWQSAQDLRSGGVPIMGFTWYSLTDQVDWDIQLREIRGTVNGNGLFTLDRQPRKVAEQFRALAQRYGSEPIVPEE
ncbi:MAG: family 1 glycosylhydrolase [Acidobacteriia bacterium]|nr:family 1 glycosylhydrolase [Terriglobia bacterium]